ncbi:MAG: hypothetical protein D3925_16055 [Candidatus Electrothrix sp. AR5]|nr:hypothetical protein [Candidatus Electrothrix sp. AR5]
MNSSVKITVSVVLQLGRRNLYAGLCRRKNKGAIRELPLRKESSKKQIYPHEGAIITSHLGNKLAQAILSGKIVSWKFLKSLPRRINRQDKRPAKLSDKGRKRLHRRLSLQRITTKRLIRGNFQFRKFIRYIIHNAL